MDTLFAKYATGGEMSYAQFKGFIKETGLKPDPNMKFAMELFSKYDADGGGSIVRRVPRRARSNPPPSPRSARDQRRKIHTRGARAVRTAACARAR